MSICMILVYEVCSILRVTKKCNLPSNGCEVVDGNLGDGGLLWHVLIVVGVHLWKTQSEVLVSLSHLQGP